MSIHTRLAKLENAKAGGPVRTELINLTDAEIEQLLREVEADDGPLLREVLVNAGGLRLGGRRWADVPESELDAAMERMMAPLVKQQSERAERERECRDSFQRHLGCPRVVMERGSKPR